MKVFLLVCVIGVAQCFRFHPTFINRFRTESYNSKSQINALTKEIQKTEIEKTKPEKDVIEFDANESDFDVEDIFGSYLQSNSLEMSGELKETTESRETTSEFEFANNERRKQMLDELRQSPGRLKQEGFNFLPSEAELNSSRARVREFRDRVENLKNTEMTNANNSSSEMFVVDPMLLRDACVLGDLSTLTLLLSFGADPNFSDRSGASVFASCVSAGGLLACAGGHGYPACLRALLRAGAAPLQVDANGRHALDRAKSIGHPRLLALLLRHAPSLSASFATSFSTSLPLHHAGVLLRHTPSFSTSFCAASNATSASPPLADTSSFSTSLSLCRAILSHSPGLTRLLLAHGKNPNLSDLAASDLADLEPDLAHLAALSPLSLAVAQRSDLCALELLRHREAEAGRRAGERARAEAEERRWWASEGRAEAEIASQEEGEERIALSGFFERLMNRTTSSLPRSASSRKEVFSCFHKSNRELLPKLANLYVSDSLNSTSLHYLVSTSPLLANSSLPRTTSFSTSPPPLLDLDSSASSSLPRATSSSLPRAASLPPVSLCVLTGQHKLLRALLRAGASPDSLGRAENTREGENEGEKEGEKEVENEGEVVAPIDLAVASDDLHCARALLDFGACKRGARAQSALFLALLMRRTAMARLLLEAGENGHSNANNGITNGISNGISFTSAAANGIDANGCSELMLCALADVNSGIELLLSYGADANYRHSSISSVNEIFSKYNMPLVDEKEENSEKSNENNESVGVSALMLAVARGNGECVTALLNGGADFEVEKEGEKLMDLARGKCREILLKHIEDKKNKVK